jgi:hypothetical protein
MMSVGKQGQARQAVEAADEVLGLSQLGDGAVGPPSSSRFQPWPRTTARISASSGRGRYGAQASPAAAAMITLRTARRAKVIGISRTAQ